MYDHAFTHRGNQADYVLGTVRGDWTGFEVVRFHLIEELSSPFRAEILLRRHADDGPADLDELVDTGATLRIATEHRWRSIHGIITEAEEADRTDKLFYYRVVLMPHWIRAKHRIRCRTFVNQPLREILEFVLQNKTHPDITGPHGLFRRGGDPSPADAHPLFKEFQEPKGEFRLRMPELGRLKSEEFSRFVVQYNESDFDFVARLLEANGLSYYFQHSNDACVMVICDGPGQTPLFARDETLMLRGHQKSGSSGGQEVLRSLRDTRRLKSNVVTVFDYDWQRSDRRLSATRTTDEMQSEAVNPEALGVFAFPAQIGTIHEQTEDFAARIRMERLDCERLFCEGTGTLRTMEPGHRGRVHSVDGLRSDTTVLVVRVESMAVQHDVEGSALEGEAFGWGKAMPTLGAYENRFTLLPSHLHFRPAIRTPKPKIAGIQTARVSAEDATTVLMADTVHVYSQPDIHCDEFGRVRLRFPWDQRTPQENVASSDWVRVSHFWAGTSYGAQHVPRVGQEVLVAFMHGDPDWPVIVGRVYNPQVPVPYPPGASAKAKTQTAWKSSSTTVFEPAEGYNEIRFTDFKGEEEVYLQAEKDLNELVKDSHSTTVGGDQSNSVGHNQSNTVGNNRTHSVQGTEDVHVHGDRTTQFDANESHTVDGYLKTVVGINEAHKVGGFRKTEVGANDDLNVAGWRNTHVGTGENRTVSGPDGVNISADRRVSVGGSHLMSANANHEMSSTHIYMKAAGDIQGNAANTAFYDSGSFHVNAAGCTLEMSAGKLVIDNGAGAKISLVGGMIVINSAGPTEMSAGGDISAKAPNIRLNG